MGLWDRIKGEFIDVIEWENPNPDDIVFKYPRYDNAIKSGAKLNVKPATAAIFVNEGKVADVFQAGTHDLVTQNMPIMTTLQSWKYGFNSPFKAEVYYVALKVFQGLKWGTANPFMLRDPEFGPIRLKAFGTYTMKVVDVQSFVTAIAGTDDGFHLDEVTEQLRNFIITRFTDLIASSKVAALDLASNLNEFCEQLVPEVNKDFNTFGLETTKITIANISFPPEVEKMLDKRSSMGILGDLNKFNQFQTGLSMEEAAKNPNGGANQGIGMGMGFAMANQMTQQYNQNNQQNQGPNNMPPPPPVMAFFVAVNGQQTGPFDMNTLANMAANGQFNPQSQVWRQGMAAWAAASAVPELGQVFMQMPPPPPPVG
jgi:membrane protease subunit (stomatin/prohibitin family)